MSRQGWSQSNHRTTQPPAVTTPAVLGAGSVTLMTFPSPSHVTPAGSTPSQQQQETPSQPAFPSLHLLCGPDPALRPHLMKLKQDLHRDLDMA